MKRPLSILLAATLFAATAYGQSLADLARQERTRKAGLEAKIKVNNDTVKNSTATPPSVVGKPAAPETAAAEKPAAGKPTGPTDRKGRDEKWWRTAFEEVRADLKDAEDQIKIIQSKQNQAHVDYLTKTDLYNRELRMATEINSLNKEMEQQQARADKDRKKIEELEDDLRTSGGPPGWAR
jgi:DNA repair exonuclease SbcCD ATPase subunit